MTTYEVTAKIPMTVVITDAEDEEEAKNRLENWYHAMVSTTQGEDVPYDAMPDHEQGLDVTDVSEVDE